MERDRFLTEAMGHVWHECQDNPDGFHCRQCAEGLHRTADFSTWDGFGELWGWAQLQDWWGEFFGRALYNHARGDDTPSFGFDIPDSWVMLMLSPQELINPDYYANAVYMFLKDRPCAP